MKSKQEQIDEMTDLICTHKIDNIRGVNICGIIDMPCNHCCTCAVYAKTLYDAGYGKVSEYKAEREMLGSQIKVLKQRLNDKYIEVDNLNRDYHNSFERLKAQEREITRLKAENEKRLTCDFVKTVQKQAQIDILNKAKEKLDSAPNGWAYTGYIDDLIKEVQDE